MRDLNLRETTKLLAALIAGDRFLKDAPRWSRDELLAWQWERVLRLVGHAWKTVPFYRRHYEAAGFALGDLKTWDDFRRLPVVTKSDVIANYPHAMLRAGEAPERLIVSRSSGSSGQVLDICYDSRAMVTYLLAGLRLYRMGFDYRPWHTQLYVYTSPYPLSSLLGLFPMRFVPTLAPIETIAAEAERARPHLLVCYPSHLKQVAPALSEKGRSRLRCVSVNSEMSTQAERDALARELGCPVLDEYSSEELTRIAAQCRCGRYHVFEDINYLETLPSADAAAAGASSLGASGVVVGTNLHNFAMPMIRYVQNDIARLAGEASTCGCGWKFRELSDLQGRKNDSFLLPSGRELSSGFLLDATYEILLTWRTAARDFCLVQEARDRVVLEVVRGEGWSGEVAAAIARRFQGFFEDGVVFEITLVAECRKTKTGKRNPIIRAWREPNS
jgi:phenylacetate-CoA ligase